MKDSKISKKIIDHANDINKFQDELFTYIEVKQIPPAAHWCMDAAGLNRQK